MDPISAAFMTFGVILLAISWIQLMFTSFRNDFSWGLTTVFLPPLAYFYCFFNMQESKPVLGLAGLGSTLIIFGLI